MMRMRAVLLAILFVSARVSTAFAQGAVAEGSSEDTGKKEEARTRFVDGLLHFDRSEWDAALAEFLASRELFATRAATMDAAICLHQVRRFDEALDMWESLVRDFPDLRAGDRAIADREIADLQRWVGAIDVRSTEVGASVVIDGRPRGTTPLSPLRVGVGTHIVRVYKEGFAEVEVRVDVAGHQTAIAEARLDALTQSGRLQITEHRGRSLDLVVDNILVGKTPWTGTLGVGHHVLALRGEGNLGTQPVDAAVALNQVIALSLLAENLEASARIEPTPAGAAVAIDRVVVGHGVWEGRLRAGTHEIEVGEEGFIPFHTNVTLQVGGHSVVVAPLERDVTSSLWAMHVAPKLVVEFDSSLLLSPSFGGLPCANPCRASVPLGGQEVAHVGYQHPTGFGFGIDIGYLALIETLKDRPTTIHGDGSEGVSDSGTATDTLLLSGFTLGGSAFYRRGNAWPVTLRVGVGVLLGSIHDARTGQFEAMKATNAADSTYSVSASDTPLATFLYAAPEVRIGRRIGDHFELSVGVQAMLLAALNQAVWSDNGEIPLAPQLAGSTARHEGIGGFAPDPLVGSFLLVVAPSVGAHLEF
jgi:hypothetical protein